MCVRVMLVIKKCDWTVVASYLNGWTGPSNGMESFLCCGSQVYGHKLNIFACTKLLASTCFMMAFVSFLAWKVTRGYLKVLNFSC